MSYQIPVTVTKGDRLFSGIKYGLLITVVIVLVWWAWSALMYRYSINRLTPKLVDKYEDTEKKLAMQGSESLDPPALRDKILAYDQFERNHYTMPENVMVSEDKAKISANIKVINVNTQEVVRQEPIQYNLLPECDKNNVTCIKV